MFNVMYECCVVNTMIIFINNAFESTQFFLRNKTNLLRLKGLMQFLIRLMDCDKF